MRTVCLGFALASYAIQVIGVMEARGAWPISGNPVCTTPDFQGSPAMAPDAQGGTFLVWDDGRLSNDAVFGQRLDLDGNPQWAPNGIQLGPLPSLHADIVSDGSGGFVAVWWNNFDIGAQRFTANGTPVWTVGGVVVCGATGAQDWPHVLRAPNGEFIVAWRDARNGATRSDVFANRLTAATGTRLWGPNDVMVGFGTGNVSTINSLGLVEDGSGGAYLTWNSTDVENIHGQHMSSSGAGLWNGTSGLTLCNVAGPQQFPQVVGSGTNGALFVWEDHRSPDPGVYAQWVNLNGSVRYSANGLQLFSTGGFGTVLLTSGGYLVTSNMSIQQFAPLTGAPQWGPNPIDLSPPDGGPLRLISDDADGAFAVYLTNDNRLVAQHVDANGNSIWPGKYIDVCVGGHPSPPHLIKDGNGGIVAGWQDHRAPVQEAHDVYAQRIEPNGAIGVLSNLDAVSTFAPYWDAPTVPRSFAGGDVYDVHVSPTLEGNAPATYLNSLIWQSGPHAMPSWVWQFRIDSEVATSVAMPQTNDPGGYAFIDVGPITVRGGRHTFGHIMDPDHLVLENNETDNAYEGQWVWRPLVLTPGSPALRPAPPDRSLFPNPSGDGFASSRDAGFAWVISLAPQSGADDYDLYVYDDFSGSTAGFSNLLKSSLYGLHATDFVVGHYSGTPVTLYSQAVRFALGSGNEFAFDQIDATGRNAASIGNFPDQVLGVNRLADVFEANLLAGTTYHFVLNRTSPGSDLGLTVYPGAPGAIYSRQEGSTVPGAAVAEPISDLSDVVGSYIASVSGWHPIVVYRQFGDEADTPVTYSLTWSPGTTGVASDAETKGSLSFLGAVPNPARGRTSIVFRLPEPGTVRLSIYDLNGRLVRRLIEGNRGRGEERIAWDGTTDSGLPVPAGIYFARMEGFGQAVSRRVVLID